MEIRQGASHRLYYIMVWLTDSEHKMLVPVRCFTCGNVVADKFLEFSNGVKSGEDPAQIMDAIGLKKYCCRRMFLSCVETIYQVIPYYEALRRRMSEIQSEID
jgi:DNA-directed RNA polymerase subunit N